MSDFVKVFSELSDAGKSVREEEFVFKGDDQVKEAYEFGQFLGLISADLSFEDFVRNGEALTLFEVGSLYDNKLSGDELKELVRLHLLDLAEVNNRARRMELGLEGEDVVGGLSYVEPVLSEMKLETNKLDLSGSDVVGVVDGVNDFLNKKGSQNNFYVDQTDPEVYWVLYIKRSKETATKKCPYFNIAN